MKHIELEVKQYLTLKRWESKLNGEEYKIKVCPFCQSEEWSFYMSAKTSQYRCMKASCGETGNLTTLKKHLGDLTAKEEKQDSGKFISADMVETWHNRLLNKQEYLQKVLDRGISLEAIKKFRLGIRLLLEGGPVYLCIPHLENGVCRNVKYRILEDEGSYSPSDKWRREEGYKSILFNVDALDEAEEIYIAESELDAVSLWCAGYKNVVGLTVGADTFKPEWFDLFANLKQIYICLDSDNAGQKGAQDLARRLGFARCVNVIWPLKDPNKVLTDLGEDHLHFAISQASPFEVSGVVTIEQALSRRQNNLDSDRQGILSPWPSVNRLLGKGLQQGDLTILSARYKVGKSTLSLQWLTWLASQGIPSLMVNLEMPVPRLIDKIVQSVRCKSDDMIEPVDYTLTRQFLQDKPFYFLEDGEGRFSNADRIFDAMEDAVKRYGIRVVVFDHLHYLCRSMNIRDEIGHVMRRFKAFAMQFGISVILIAQPRKLNGQRPTSDDLKDSVSIATDADWIILLHRLSMASETDEFDSEGDPEEPQEILSPITEVIFDATRFRSGGRVKLYYEGETSTFFEQEHGQPLRSVVHKL